MKKQNIGVVGWLYYHDNEFGITTAACDTNKPKVEEFQHEHPAVHIYEDYREMAEKEDLDGVIISTPNWLHEEMAVYFLQKGINVFLEKPMGINREEIDSILLASLDSGKICAIDFEMRISMGHLRIKDIICSGEIGEPVGIEYIHHRGGWLSEGKGVWRTNPGLSGGLTLMEACHRIDAARSLMGEITHVQCFSFPNVLPQYSMHKDMRDNEIIHMWFEKDRRGTLIQSHTSSVIDARIEEYDKLGHDFQCIVVGTDGCIKTDLIKQSVLVCSYEDYHPDAPQGKRVRFKRLEDYSSMPSLKFHHDITGNHELFLKSCATGKPFHQDIVDAWKTHAACISVEESARNDSAKVQVDYTMPEKSR